LKKVALGLDIGGTKIAIGLVSEDGYIISRTEIPTIPEAGYDDAFRRIVKASRNLIREQNLGRKIYGIGIACAGPVDSIKGVTIIPTNIKTWVNEPIVADFREEFGIPCFLENDADAAAIAENWIGAGKGTKHMIYVTASTGIGGGIIIDGNLYRGSVGMVAEIGHIIVDSGGRLCHCGGRGCIEAMASGWAMAERAKEICDIIKNGSEDGFLSIRDEFLMRFAHMERFIARSISSIREDGPGMLKICIESPQKITARTIFDLAEKGDIIASFVANEAVCYLGVGLSNLLVILAPEMIVVGGGMTARWDLIYPVLMETVKHSLFNIPTLVIRLTKASLGRDVGIIGAARSLFLRAGTTNDHEFT
jgi:glucokinase